MDDVSNDPAPLPNYRRMTIVFSKGDSDLLDDLVKGADQLDWENVSRSSFVRALVRFASEGIAKDGTIRPGLCDSLVMRLPRYFSDIAMEALKPGPPKGNTPPKRLR